MKKQVIIGIMTILVWSCMTEMEAISPEAQTVASSGKRVRTKAGAMEFDEIKAQSALQQNLDYVLLNLIYVRDGRYALGLTKEEAIMMGIPTEVYEKYADKVVEMNKRK